MALKTPILIFCRIKPFRSEGSHDIQDYAIKKSQDKDTLVITSQQVSSVVLNHRPDFYNFQFVKVFDQKTSQEYIYDTVAKPIVESALKGYNGTVFAYGQTGSGKTYTISGDKENCGIIPRALQEIFAAVRTAKEEEFDIQMSYLEIYNEQSNDLLNTEEKKKITLREGCDGVFEWQNLSLCSVESFSGAVDLLESGDKNRIVADTPMNIFSSRSHTILTIYITVRTPETLEVRKAKLNLVDLAGSERVHKTGEEGIVLEEARHINLSLHFLQQVIIALSDSSRSHIPYRNCSLTSALRDSLGGNCMTAMVANIAVDKANIEETVSTCRFAQRVALVRNEVTINLGRDLKEENNLLKDKIQQLEKQCETLNNEIQVLKQTSIKEEISKKSEDINLHPRCHTIQQLQTDIVFLIGWVQELKTKQHDTSENDESSLANFSVINVAEQNDEFNGFAAASKEKDEWEKLKQEEKKTFSTLSSKIDSISLVHQEILNWWKHYEKSLVQEMLSECNLNILNSESVLDNQAPHDMLLDRLLHTHSDLLKDIQLLKFRLRSSKRNLQRMKRKYLMEYNSWKKTENLCQSPSVVDNFENMCIHGENKSIEADNILNYSYKQLPSGMLSSHLKNLSFGEKDIENEENQNSFLMSESDINTTFGDINDSIFSTSTLISDSNKYSKLAEPRLVRSVPGLHSSSTQSRYTPRSCYTMSVGTKDRLHIRPVSMPTFHLTGDKDVDDEIVAFYKSKCPN